MELVPLLVTTMLLLSDQKGIQREARCDSSRKRQVIVLLYNDYTCTGLL